MDHLWSDFRPRVARQLLLAGVAAFSENGFHATSTRDIASRVGLSSAGLYVHFSSKEELLYRIADLAHREVVAVVREESAPDASPADQLLSVVRAFVSWHAHNAAAARVCQYELDALSPEHLAAIAELRRTVTDGFRSLVARGIEEGLFAVRDVPSATRAMLSMGIDVARWYRPDGEHTPEGLGELYAEYCLSLVGHPPDRGAGGAPG